MARKTCMKGIMDLGIICVILCFATYSNAIQHDKPRYHQQQQVGHRTHHHGRDGNLQSGLPKKLEELLTSRFAALEQRLSRTVEEVDLKLRMQNHSLDITHLEKLFLMLNEELQISEEKQITKDKLIENLRKTANEQDKEIHLLKKRLGHLEDSVDELIKVLQPKGITSRVPEREDVDDETPPNEIRPQPTDGPGDRPSDISEIPRDCKDAYVRDGVSGMDHMYADVRPSLTSKSFKVRCHIEREQGWTVIQRRFDGSTDFFRGWKEYKNGFGDIEGEFWLGLQKIYEITNQGDYKLRLEMKTWEGKEYWAEYDHFRIADEHDLYRIHVHGYHGNAGDSLTSRWENHNGQPFSTKDNDNDGRFIDNCAEHYQGAWWFTSCFESHLNGIYKQKGSHDNYFVRDGLQWNTIHIHSSLQSVAMMVYPTDGVVEPVTLKEGNGINGIE